MAGSWPEETNASTAASPPIVEHHCGCRRQYAIAERATFRAPAKPAPAAKPSPRPRAGRPAAARGITAIAGWKPLIDAPVKVIAEPPGIAGGEYVGVGADGGRLDPASAPPMADPSGPPTTPPITGATTFRMDFHALLMKLTGHPFPPRTSAAAQISLQAAARPKQQAQAVAQLGQLLRQVLAPRFAPCAFARAGQRA